MIRASLRWRLLAGAGVAILFALAMAWLLMTLLFERHLERRLETEMTRDALALVAGLSLDSRGYPHLRDEPNDSRLRKPAGGSYWQIITSGGTLRSRSLWDSALATLDRPPEDHWRLRRQPGPFGRPVVVLDRRLVVESDHPPVVVQVAQDSEPLSTARSEFGRELAAFLAVLWAVLLLAAWLQVSLGLRPLARLRGHLGTLQRDANARLPPAHLREVQPLVDAINSLADAREKDLEQARRRAVDLAHSLKTPLAALSAQSRRAREAGADSAADGMDRSIAAIDRVVDAELTRTRLARLGQVRGASANVQAVAERVVNVLEHTEKGEQLLFAVDAPANLQLAIEEEHLSEILGALLENAAKYARRQVRLGAAAGPGWARLQVDDDGAGIAPERRDEALARGGRLDQSGSAGTGLGLAIARELVEANGGQLQLSQSDLGGLRVTVEWSGEGA